MKQKSYMTISEFARLTGIKRANLIFYDNIGLLSPEFRGKNEYRYYTRQQLASAYLITALRELGLGLDEIRQYAKGRTPERMMLLLEEQGQHIQMEINRLRRMRDMMNLYIDLAREGLDWKMEEVMVREQKREPIFLGSLVNPVQAEEESSIAFYEYAAKKGMEVGYPMGCVIAKSVLEEGLLKWEGINPVQRYYFRVKQGQNAYKPEGLYAVACGHSGYGQSGFIYEKLLHYIKEEGLHIVGDAYEEYPLNEMAIQDDTKYCVKIEIMVER